MCPTGTAVCLQPGGYRQRGTVLPAGSKMRKAGVDLPQHPSVLGQGTCLQHSFHLEGSERV